MFSLKKTGHKLSESEQRQAALKLLLDAWNSAIDQGIDKDVVASTAMFAALSDLIGAYGEDPVAEMTTELPERIRKGDFTVAG